MFKHAFYFDCFGHLELKDLARDWLLGLSPFTLLTLLPLIKPLMNTLFYFDCLGHQELKNIVAHKGLWDGIFML